MDLDKLLRALAKLEGLFEELPSSKYLDVEYVHEFHRALDQLEAAASIADSAC